MAFDWAFLTTALYSNTNTLESPPLDLLDCV
jgi:hypothetical protein